MRTLLVSACLFTVVMASIAWAANLGPQSPDYNNRRIDRLEDQRLDARLSTLESEMTEVKYLTRAVTGAVIVQLVLLGMARKKAIS
jgi:hypothetical protein